MRRDLKEFHKKEIVTHSPEIFDEVKFAADELKSGKPAIINLTQLTADERLWAVHFLNGVIYALDGTTREIGNWVFVFSPGGVIVTMEDEE